MFLVVSTWVSIGILQHRLKGKVVVDAFQSFDESISDDHLRIRAALSSAVTVTTAGIRHIALTTINVQ